jgi:O-antigen/teichoic acid export membrane protein
MLVGILSTFINLYFTSKYKPAFLANQDDYKITTINIAITILNGLISIFVLNLFNNLLIFRLISLLFSIISVLSIKLIFKRNYPNYSFSKTNLIQFNGSNDYLTSKIMNFFYYSFPSLFLSSFFGTEITSVFNIYYVISLLGSNIVLSFTSGFENSFGVKINTTKDSIKDDFEFFESITFFIVIIVFSVLVSSMIPFIRIYSKEFDQLNYLNIDFLIFVNLTSIFQLFHIPSGIIINLNGKFKIIKRIQLFALLTLVSTTFLFTYFFGLLGFLFSKLLTNFFIAFIEIYYLRTYILKSNFLKSFLKILISIILISSVFFIVNLSGNIFIVETYFDFIIILVIITLLSLFLSLPMIFFVPGLKHKLIKFFERLRASH